MVVVGRARRALVVVLATVLALQVVAVPTAGPAAADTRYVRLSSTPYASGSSDEPSVDLSGDVVAFSSHAGLLPTDDEDEYGQLSDVYVHRGEGDLVHLHGSFGDPVSEADGAWGPLVSSDGSHVAFMSSSPEWAPDDPDGVDVLRYAIGEEALQRVTFPVLDEEEVVDSLLTSISASGDWLTVESDGRFVVEDVATTAPGARTDVYALQPWGGGGEVGAEVWWLSERMVSDGEGGLEPGGQGNGPSEGGDVTDFIEGVGQRAVFASAATDLLPGGSDEPDWAYRVWLRDTNGSLEMISPGEVGQWGSWDPQISDDGTTVVYVTDADLDGGGYPFDGPQVVAYDVATRQHRLVSVRPDGSPGSSSPYGGEVPRPRFDLQLNGDGVVSFRTEAFDLRPGDEPGSWEYFAADLSRPGPVTLFQPTSALAGDDVEGLGIGRSAVVFASQRRLALDDQDDTSDVYRQTDELPPPAPAASIRLAVAAAAPVGLDAVPIAEIPAERIPFTNVEIGATPLKAIDVAVSPLKAIPLKAIPLKAIEVGAAPLKAIPLRAIPLKAIAGSWESLLAGTPLGGRPLEDVTFGDVLLLIDQYVRDGVAHPVVALGLADIDLTASPLKAISIASLALGATPLKAIPLKAIGADCSNAGDAGAVNLCNWAAVLADLGISVALDDTTTVLSLDLMGAPLKAIPLKAIPLKAIDLQASPLKAIPLKAIALNSAPLKAIPLKAIDLQATPLKAIRVFSLANPMAVVDCENGFHCWNDPTLEQAAAAGAIREGVTLGQLLALTLHPGETDPWADLTVGDLLAAVRADLDPATAAALDQTLTLGAVLLGLLLQTDFPWEELPIDDMRLQDVAPPDDDLLVEFEATPGALPLGESTYQVSVTLPPRAVYRPGSALVQRYPEANTPHDNWVPLPPPDVTGSTLSWTVGHDVFQPYLQIQLRVLPGLRLEEEDLAVSVAGLAADASYMVQERGEFDASFDEGAPEPRELPADTLVVGHLGTPGDVDLYRLADPGPGKRVSLHLSGLDLDGDLVLYRPSTAVDAVASRDVPLRAAYVPAEGVTHDGVAGDLAPSTLADVPLSTSLPVADVSAHRGEGDEAIDLSTTRGTGDLTIQVSAYNGSSSSSPYVLRVRVVDDPAYEECDGVVFDPPHAGEGVVGASTPARDGIDTLFVVNQQRLGDLYGAGPAGEVMGALGQFTGSAPVAGVRGRVLAVDGSLDTREAYAAWDREPCSPAAANAVVESIVAQIDAAVAATPTITSVVLVGDDVALPFARTPDLTTIANEREYAESVGSGNPLSASATSEHVLSDAPYGDRDPIPFLNRQLFVPDVGLGRLVEQPTDIVEALEEFVDRAGVLPAESGLVAGYDFLSDGADAVASALGSAVEAVDTLVDETWTADALRDEVRPSDGTATPDVLSVNAHYDHHRLLPAAGNATSDESDLVDVADFGDADPDVDTLEARLLFTMGCHGGLNVPDLLQSASEVVRADWPQTVVTEGGVHVGNTGFGYGDDATVALSEDLMAAFAERLDRMDVGAALTFAKQDYMSRLGAFGAYDEKVLSQATLYGLPMYRLDGGAAGVPPQSEVDEPTVDPDTGILTSSTTVTPQFTTVELDDGTRFETADDERPLVVQGRPIQPRVTMDVTAADGSIATGALITGLVSQDEEGVAARFARPIIHSVENEPVVAADVPFPGGFQTVNRHRDPSGERDRLVLVPGQFVPDLDPGTAVGTGMQRRFVEMDVDVLYAQPDVDDFRAPDIASVRATPVPGGMGYSVDVSDDSGIVRVLVLQLDASGTWSAVDLSPQGGLWQNPVPAPAVGTSVDYLVQAVDANGNVGVSSNKDALYLGSGDRTPPTVTIAAPTDGTRVEVGATLLADYDCDDLGSTPSCVGSVGGVAVPDGAAVPTGSPGTFTLQVRSEDAAGNVATASSSYEVVDPDRTPPFVSIDSPADGFTVDRDAVLDLVTRCSDDRPGVDCRLTVDGVAATVGTHRLDTSQVGTHTVVLAATDAAGNHSSLSSTYVVRAPQPQDVTPPTISFAAPSVVQRGVVVTGAFSCADAGGVAHCEQLLAGGRTSDTTLRTDRVGPQQLRVRAEDASGNVAEASFDYVVTWTDPAVVQRFGAPMGSPDTFTQVKAGSTTPLKFTLLDRFGRAIDDRSAIAAIGHVAVPCTGPPGAPPAITTTFDLSGLSHSGGQWHLNWKSDKAATGCVQVQVRLSDGWTVVTGLVRFK